MLQGPRSSESTSWFSYSSAVRVPSKAHFNVILRFRGKWLNKYLNIKIVVFLNAKTCGERHWQGGSWCAGHQPGSVGQYPLRQQVLREVLEREGGADL